MLLIKYFLNLGGCDAIGVVPLLGSVPAYYREVYEAICCRTDERVQVEVFLRLLQRTDLSKAVLGQVRASHLFYCGGQTIMMLQQAAVYKKLR